MACKADVAALLRELQAGTAAVLEASRGADEAARERVAGLEERVREARDGLSEDIRRPAEAVEALMESLAVRPLSLGLNRKRRICADASSADPGPHQDG
jgi:hypothetical protein